jgi:hypothetical protein
MFKYYFEYEFESKHVVNIVHLNNLIVVTISIF